MMNKYVTFPNSLVKLHCNFCIVYVLYIGIDNSSQGPTLTQCVDVIVTSECIHPYILCIVPRCLFWDVSVM